MPESRPSLLACIESSALTADRRAALERLAGARRLVLSPDRATIESELDSVEIAVGSFPAELLADAPRLRWYQQFGTGVDWLLARPAAAASPFILTNCSDDHYAVVADHAFALVLALTRGLPDIVRAQDRREWAAPARLASSRHFQLKGKTILLAGLGSIGAELAKRARAFGMRALGVRKDPGKSAPDVERVFGIHELNTALAEADLVACSLPLTQETTGVFGATAFAAMKPTAFFVNIGRGALVDEAALDAALRAGTIAGAASDVFATEPLPTDSPLWTAPNMLVSPHLGGCYDQILDTWIGIALDNLRRYQAGEPLRNIVDKRSGY